MAKCKLCKTNIPDGVEYCGSCQEKGSINANESYLDSLLNSVKNTAPSAENIYKKNNKKNNTKVEESSYVASSKVVDEMHKNSPEIEFFEEDEFGLQDYSSYDVDLGDIDDFDQYYLSDDFKEFEEDIVISDEELFGQDLSEILSGQVNETLKQESQKLNFNNVPEDIVSNQNIKLNQNIKGNHDIDDLNVEHDLQQEELLSLLNKEPSSDNEIKDKLNSENIEINKVIDTEELLDNDYIVGHGDIDVTGSKNSIEDTDFGISNLDTIVESDNIGYENSDISYMDDIYNNDNIIDLKELSELEEEEDFDTDLNNLLNSLNTIPEDYLSNNKSDIDTSNTEEEQSDINEVSSKIEDYEMIHQEEDDFLSLLNQINDDDPVSEDIKAINDLLLGKSVETSSKSGVPSDVGEVFSDALKAVSSLNDSEYDENELLNNIGDNAKSKKGKKRKLQKEKNKEIIESKEKKQKKNLFQLLFGNIKSENDSNDEIASAKSNDDESSDANGKEALGKKAKGKKAKVKKEIPKKGAAKTEESSEASEDDNKREKTSSKKETKKEKKLNKKKTKEVIQVIDEIEEDEGRINRIGASIVFVFFALLAILVYAGTNMVSYTISIENATNYFDKQKYTEAYNEVYGMEIKDEDIEIYDKIMTVMFVNKQLNSYNNYYSIGEYPEALDSLLKGMERYDKYIELATMLGIESDLNYVRNQILAELENVFMLSEKEAMKIISYKDMDKYSLAVYDVVLENMSN